ncbi:GntR family transcriptional regulator [Uniformispora flossi]|uniref:GntR family transcriptional regulator n=1 Tax=Uniformispora flossi TaxID=3390723 RepID=UPI003C2E9E05
MFRLDAGSGVPIYRQLMQQVRQEVLLGRLSPGDRLPTVKEIVDALAVNPNTVAKAYRELEHEGVVYSRQGKGTFVADTSATLPLDAPPALLAGLTRWVRKARAEGLTSDQMRALLAEALDEPDAEADPEPGNARRAARSPRRIGGVA